MGGLGPMLNKKKYPESRKPLEIFLCYRLTPISKIFWPNILHEKHSSNWDLSCQIFTYKILFSSKITFENQDQIQVYFANSFWDLMTRKTQYVKSFKNKIKENIRSWNWRKFSSFFRAKLKVRQLCFRFIESIC